MVCIYAFKLPKRFLGVLTIPHLLLHPQDASAEARSPPLEVGDLEAAAATNPPTNVCSSLAPLMDQLPVIVSLMDASSTSARDPASAAARSSSSVVLYQNKQSLQYYGRMTSSGGGQGDSPTSQLDAMKHLLSLQQDPEGTLAVRACNKGREGRA